MVMPGVDGNHNWFGTPELGALAEALAKAQAEMQNPTLDKANAAYVKNGKPSYASLATVRNAVIPVLSKHGLAILQLPYRGSEGVGCTTVLIHSQSGQHAGVCFTVPVAKPDAHGVGSALTYARRYSLMAIAGVVGDEDDDGNEAVGKVPGNVAAGVQTTQVVSAKQTKPTATTATTDTVGKDWRALFAAATTTQELYQLGAQLAAADKATRDAMRPAFEARTLELAGAISTNGKQKEKDKNNG